MEEEFIVKGAMATCQFGVAPAMLNNIMDNMNVYFNGKLAATSMTMGPVFPAPAFGTCNMVPNMPKPCVAMITKWDNVYSGMYINRISNPLTKNSKGTCALGCPMCISFQTTGQIPIPTVPIMEMSAFEHQSDMNLLAIDDLEEEEDDFDEDNPLSESIKKSLQKRFEKKGKDGENKAIYAKFHGNSRSVEHLREQLDDADLVYDINEKTQPVSVAILGSKKGIVYEKEALSAKETPILPSEDAGKWEPKRDKNGKFTPDPNGKPTRFVAEEGKVIPWSEITKKVETLMNEHNGTTDFKFDGVQYVNGHPDFEKYSLGKVEINFYSNNRDYNFRQARELMAKQLNERHPNGVKMKNGKNRPYRASDVKKYMEDPAHHMTWHENNDCKTILKVPSELHGNIDHSGGISKLANDSNKAFNLPKKTTDKNQNKKQIISI